MYHLLIADDEFIERKVLNDVVYQQFKEECTLFQAENGRKAIEIVKENGVDIALMDIEMPGINGIEAAREIKKICPDCCIIFLTAYDEFSYAKEAISLHVLDYLLKPYHESELFAVIEEGMHLVKCKQKYSREYVKVPEQTEEMNVKWEEPTGDLSWLRSQQIAQEIERYVHNNFKEEISMQDVAREMNYSDAYFSKFFKKCFQQNFTSYLTELRIEEAKKLLEKPTVNIKDVGAAVGYPDSNYFSKVFKRTTGMKPSDYRLTKFYKIIIK